MDDDNIKEIEERLKNRHSDRTYNFFRPVGQIIEHVDTINFTMDKDGTFHFENIGQVNASKLPNEPEDVDAEEKIRLCITLLMNERILVKKNGKDVEEPLFNLQNHWQAIYRILVDKKYCKDSDFEGFDLFINKVMPDKVNALYKKSSVKQISQTDFNKPFEKWEYDAETSGTRKPYDRMKAIAQRFLEILEDKGL